MKIRVLISLLLFWAFVPFVTAENNIKVINRVNTKQKVVALTFDADMTPKMLDMLQKKIVLSWYNKSVIDTLEKEKVPATLFLTGMWIERYPKIAKKLSENPLFEIGNHSFSHPAFSSPCYQLPTTSESEDASQIIKTDALLSKYTAQYSHLFRFPGLCYDSEDLKTALSLGYVVIGGDVRGNDGFQKKTDTIVSQVVSLVRPGSIVVLHMMGGPNAPHTGDALPVIINKLRKEGYRFVTISDLLKM